MVDTATRSSNRVTVPRGTALGGALVGVALGIAGWWAVYSAWRVYAAGASSIGGSDTAMQLGLRAAIGTVTFVLVVAAIRWRAVATGLALAGTAGILISAYLRLVVDGSLFLLGLQPNAAPGHGIVSANPVLGVLNDLGYAVTEGVFAPPLLVLSAGWLAIALAWWLPSSVGGRTGPRAESKPAIRVARVLEFALGGLLALSAIVVTGVATRAMTQMFIQGERSAMQAVVLLLASTGATLILVRLPASLLGAASAAAVALTVSALQLITSTAGLPSATIWSLDLSDVASAISASVHAPETLILSATWFAALASWAYVRVRT